MKLIYKDETGAITFDKYFSYIESIEGKLPEAVYNYAIEYEHYNLSSNTSLHDAWLECCEVKEAASGTRHEIRKTEVSVNFLGPFHDKRLKFVYKNVSQYRVEATSCEKGMGDLNIHELSLNEDNSITHEFYFINGSVTSVTFNEFEYYEENV